MPILLALLRQHFHRLPAATAREVATEALTLAQAENDAAAQGTALTSLGLVDLYSGARDTATEYFHRALAVYEGLNHTVGMTNQFINLGIAYRKGDPQKSLQFMRQALAFIDEHDDERLAGCYNGIGSAYLELEQWEEAAQEFQRTRRHANACGDRQLAAGALQNEGIAQRHLGNLTHAIAALEAALGLARTTGFPRLTCGVLGSLGSTRLAQGRLEEAKEAASESLSIAEEVGAMDFRDDTLAVLVQICEKLGDEEQARSYSELLTRSN